jgi:uncharacterized protein (TIGR02266 family)
MTTDVAEPRREHARGALEIAVTLESEHNFWAGITDNISEGGVFVATNAPPPIGTRVELILTLPSHPEPFALQGVVRWTRERSTTDLPIGCGIQWQDLPRDAAQAIARFIAQRETILYDDDDGV